MALERSYHQDDMLAAFTRLKAIAQRASFPTADERRHCLKHLEAALLRSEASLLSALQKDFGHRGS
ncbi:hypothetical protein AB8616_18035 [Marinomonas sp. RS-M-Aa-14]|uniref:hypothetical protein n=1 Tax=Marinomonas sp. RS-M-Aa-14 TaxID=3241169 RepID=UPI003AAD3DA3